MINTIPRETIDAIHNTKHYIVERARTARRFIKLTNPPYSIDSLQIFEIQKDNTSHLQKASEWFSKDLHVGLLSESGMPGIADPGNILVEFAHNNGVKVKSFTGPSSIFLALAASGLNGQNFAFNGYLPIKEHELKKELQSLETKIFKHKQTQIFIEAPYRNDRLFQILIKEVNPKIKLCIARDLTGESEYVFTQTVSGWKKTKSFNIGKFPTIFILG